MARKRSVAADKDQFISPTALPAWIEIESDKELSGEVIEYLAKRAAYVGSFHGAGNENRLNWLIDAHCALGAGSIGEWNDLLDKFYPPHPLILGETPHSHTSDAKVKAHFLGFALSRLLKLVGASPTVANDVQILLSGYPVTERKTVGHRS